VSKRPVLDVYDDDDEDDDNANAVYVGVYHAMILLTDGSQCWGQDSSGSAEGVQKNLKKIFATVLCSVS
jgi:hypothetical protein